MKEISDPDLLTSIGTLVQEAREQHKLEYGSMETDDLDDDDTTMSPNIAAELLWASIHPQVSVLAKMFAYQRM